MKTMVQRVLYSILAIIISGNSLFAQSPLAYLEETYPKLTELYREELSKYPAHYIFAVDVSGTMNQYSSVVTQALQPFFQALPDNDRVDVIPFGTEALPNMLSYCGVINPEVKGALNRNINNLYVDPTYQQGFKAYTDIPKAVMPLLRLFKTTVIIR